MILHFCPQCGCKLQAGFKFCPSCGEKLPCEANLTVPDLVPAADDDAQQESAAQITDESDGAPIPGLSRPPLQRMRQTTSRARQRQTASRSAPAALGAACADLPATSQSPGPRLSPRKCQSSPKVKQEKDSNKSLAPVTGPSTPPPEDQSPQVVRSARKRKQASPVVKQEEEPCIVPTLSASPRSSPAARGRTKRAKSVCPLEPLQDGQQLSDTSGRNWRVKELLAQSEVELVYAAQLVTSGTSSSCKHILKLAPKDGKIFNEQNFLQRAAKSPSVEKWKKLKKQDFLGIPACDGFGLHADMYRFLILPNMGRTLQSIMESKGGLLSQKVMLQIACRVLDVLEYIHENEYVHADINAENIYITPSNVQVYLAGYYHAFRYCPGGKHVEYREGSRTPHEGTVEFISVDLHKGAGPSRRSDLQTLGYCVLRWLAGPLPWTALTDSPAKVAAEKERYLSDVKGLLSHCFTKRMVPGVVQVFLTRVMSLQYTECPDYQQLRGGLHDTLQKMGVSLDQPLDLQV
ncbi:inactive serine/threonine-protein kinase VRK3 [Brienomyrus brachyistius]|uniref:inactive serine/threonine-protein kinase VRK3 n=1 Tax=Brienomyrus brachyistius TaxID=42636 RepID=UPI0020B2EFD0|nr:inactive serine/threonine-protein kinase VRK3 [Brienomyrus brachyistius]XP_048887431.1 inactive serine/threonine-protein kinase VRK3 [Brienomyrus brachyistius]